MFLGIMNQHAICDFICFWDDTSSVQGLFMALFSWVILAMGEGYVVPGNQTGLRTRQGVCLTLCTISMILYINFWYINWTIGYTKHCSGITLDYAQRSLLVVIGESVVVAGFNRSHIVFLKEKKFSSHSCFAK